MVTYPFRTNRAPTFGKEVFFSLIRTFTERITIAQARYLLLPTTQQYLDFCRKNDVVPRSLHTQDHNGKEVVAHWLGEPNADFVVLYLHGGGYTQPATEGYMHFWKRYVDQFHGSGEQTSMAVLLVAYTLAPEATYPAQLREAGTALSQLIKAGRSPSRIIIAGDSAGGGLSFSLFSHLLHPHPEVQEITLYEPLAGALLISPWVTFSTEDSSMTRNFYTDYLHPIMLRKWAAMFLGKSTDQPEADQARVFGDSWAEALPNKELWWHGLHGVVSDILVWSGSNEILVDSIRAFEPLLKQGWKDGGGQEDRVVFIETKARAHIEPIMSVMLEPKQKGEHQIVVEEWLQAHLDR